MRRDRPVAWSEARRVFAVLHEVRDLGGDPLAWRARLLDGLCSLVGGAIGIGSELRIGSLEPLAAVDAGPLGERERATLLGHCSPDPAQGDPADARLARIAFGSFTAARSALVGDRAWYRSYYANEVCRPAGVDRYLVSHRLLPRFGAVHSLVLMRAWGERPFRAPELRLVDRVHDELALLWDAEPAPPRLPPALARVLEALRAGDSEKQAADRLGLTPATLHTYVKALHRRLGVHSRGELLARTARPPPYPQLWVEASRPNAGRGVLRAPADSRSRDR